MARKLKDDKWSAFLDYVAFYISYLWVPALVLLVWYWRAGALATPFFLVAIGLLALCFYGRFIEPRWLVVKHTRIDLTPVGYEGPTTEISAALFSDTHYGIFRNVMPLKRLRQKIEHANADIVLVAGDLTNHLRPDELEWALGDFANFRQPVFAVLGNHDYGLPGWIMPEVIAGAIRSFGVQVLENETTSVTVGKVELKISGLRDHYAGTADYSLLASPDIDPVNEDPGMPHLVIAHNADAAHDYPHGSAADLTVSGHTHGGQIRLPLVYRKIIPTRHRFDQGLYHANGYKVYVSSGTGMDVLPVRLFVPPCLDILILTVPERDTAPDSPQVGGQGSG